MPETTDQIIKRQELAEAPPAVGMMPVSRITSEDRSRMRSLGELLANSYHQGQFRKMPWPDNFNKETPEIRRAYREMLRDGTIRSAFYSKILSVASLDVQVMPADDSPAAQRVADFVKWNLTQSSLGGFPKIVRSILEGGCSEGYSLCEPRIDIQRRGKYRLMYTLQKFKGKDSKLFDLEVDNFDEITSVYVKATNRRINPDRFVIWSYLSMFEAVIGSSDFRACYREFLIIDVAMKMAAIDVERFVLPMMKGTYKESDQKELMEEALRTARSLGFTALPDGATIEAIQLATAGPDRIDARIKMCQANVFTCMTGASLQAMEGQKTGSLAQGRVHQNQSQLPVWFLANEVAEVLKSQLVPTLVDLNFGDETDLPQVVVSGVDDAATTGFADLVEKAQRMGLKPSRKDVAKRMGIQEAQTPDDELVASSAGSGLGGMPPIGANGPTDQQMGIFSQRRRKSKSRGRCVRYSSLAICGDGLSGDEDEDDGNHAAGFAEKKKYSSTQFNLPGDLARRVITLATQVKDEHLIDHGRESEPHITAKYGLHTDNPFQLRALLAGFGPVHATIGGISLFENLDADVIKLDVESDDLHRLNSLITTGMECTETRGEYCPHITIAYVKPGMGKKYLGLNTQGLSGTLIGLDQLKFSNVDREKTTIFLSSGTVTAFAEAQGPPGKGGSLQTNLVAASGQDERRVLKLLRTAREEGTKLLLNLARSGLKQGLSSRESSNFVWTQEQRGQLAQFFTSLLTTGEMLGRARIRLRADQWIRRGRVRGFSEPTDFSVFSSPPGIMPAEEAIRYFNSLVPSLQVVPSRVLPSLERSAFTLAITTQHQIQTMIQKVIGQKLEKGRTDGAQVIDDILKFAGLSPKNPSYPENVLRTNSMDSWNVGQDRERQTPEMMGAFPVFQYVGIADGRERSWHRVHFDKYFPAAMSFVQVRDAVKVSPWFCRCSQIPIDRATWQDLQELGAILSTP